MAENELKAIARDVWVNRGLAPEKFDLEWDWYTTRKFRRDVPPDYSIKQTYHEALRILQAQQLTESGER